MVALEQLDRQTLKLHQADKLRGLLTSVLARNPFYGAKLRHAGLTDARNIATLDPYRDLPFTTKEELSADQANHPPYGTNLSCQPHDYIRIHQTSGTTGEALRWLDTPDSWDWWGRCWAAVYRGAGVSAADRIFFAFSFGPFIGFWSAHEGARHIGALALPGGGMSSEQRLRAIMANNVTTLVCTPTYALHLAEVAAQEKIDIAASSVRTTIHAGEPGASLPATKARIQAAWGASTFDHAGATEVGAWGFECQAQQGVHLNEAEFIAEVIDPATGQAATSGELVLSNLGRVGMPVIRYRTGDQVKLNTEPCSCGRSFYRLEGGVIGRLDDALIVRGVNIYPSAIENLIRRFSEIGEFAVDVHRRETLDELEIRLEVNNGDRDAIAAAIGRDVRSLLGLRATVKCVTLGELPRFELKARRFTDYR